MSASLHVSVQRFGKVHVSYKDYKLFYTYTHYKNGFVNPREGHYLSSDQLLNLDIRG